jgi:biofilm protein TabA
MILCRLDEADRYAGVVPGLERAFALLRRGGWAELSPGRHEVDGDALYLVVVQQQGVGREAARLEAHRRYLDVQYSLSGTDSIGWSPVGACSVSAPYSPEQDVEFYSGPPVTWVEVPPGYCAIFFPEDAHAPAGGTGMLHKLVVKVAIE